MERVELRNVTKRFDEVVAVDNITLTVRPGEFLTLLGPSGCGKTTLLRMISGFETPDAGSVLLDGVDVTQVPPYRRDVNQVFQSYALFPHLTVRENISFGLRMQNLPREQIATRVAEGIELVSLTGLEDRRPSQLSGGQRQRVALARALVRRPKVLLLDEPLAALDAKLRAGMQVELKRLQKRLGMTFIFVTHDQEEAMTMSDRIAVINHGKVEQMGETSEIYHRPATAFVAAFLGQANVIEATAINPQRARLPDGTELSIAQNISGNVIVSIRPEKIGVTREPAQNRFAAEVKEELFKGASDQLLLRTRGGLELTVIVANAGAGRETFHVGDHVWCEVHADDVVVVEADNA
jgi:spermidine/putrescine transport system ATP-binding protein